MKPPIAGITRVRNEAAIIEGALNHYAEICDAGIFVLDEASDDATNPDNGTVEICRGHPAVRGVICLSDFQTDPTERRRFEGWPRQTLFDLAVRQINRPDLWVVCFDADERMEWPGIDEFDFAKWGSARFRLWDCAITSEDAHYTPTMMEERRWFGPEYRDIAMAFKATEVNQFIDRAPAMHPYAEVCPRAGDVRHYGKAISVEEWERTCHYYSTYQPEPFRSKWLARKGKAVKRDMLSDFGAPLMLWEEREEKGFKLVDNSAR